MLYRMIFTITTLILDYGMVSYLDKSTYFYLMIIYIGTKRSKKRYFEKTGYKYRAVEIEAELGRIVTWISSFFRM